MLSKSWHQQVVLNCYIYQVSTSKLRLTENGKSPEFYNTHKRKNVYNELIGRYLGINSLEL